MASLPTTFIERELPAAQRPHRSDHSDLRGAAAALGIQHLPHEGFRTVNYTMLTLRTAAFLGIVAAGQTMVILMGGIDLSVAAVITMTGVVAGNLMTRGRAGRRHSGDAVDCGADRRLQRPGRDGPAASPIGDDLGHAEHHPGGVTRL